MGWGNFLNLWRNSKLYSIMSKFIIQTNCDFNVELAKELSDFSDDQMQGIKDINLILQSAGLKIYGQIGTN